MKKIVVLVLLIMLLTACDSLVENTPISTLLPAKTPTSISTKIPASVVTETLIVPMIEVDGIQIPDSKASNPDFFNLASPDSPIVQFANAFGVKPEEVGNLTPQLLTGVDGNQFVVMTTGDLSATTSYDESGTPLLIAKQGENGEWKWQQTTTMLAEFGKLNNINVGSIIGVNGEEIQLWKDNEKIVQNFNVGTIPYRYTYDTLKLNNRDVLFRLNAAEYFGLSGNLMVLHLLDDDDLKTLLANTETLGQVKQIVSDVIQQEVDLFKGQADVYSVLNEVHPPLYGQALWDKYGDQFIIDIYQVANNIIKTSDPNAQIIYNETYNYSKYYTFYPNTLRIVNLLKSQNLIDGVGMQMHMFLWSPNDNSPEVNEIIEIMKSFEIPVYITEFDINQANLGSGTSQEKNLEQAEIGYIVTKGCVDSKVCTNISFFGTEDNYSWGPINGFLFDENENPKAFYYAVLKALYEG